MASKKDLVEFARVSYLGVNSLPGNELKASETPKS